MSKQGIYIIKNK